MRRYEYSVRIVGVYASAGMTDNQTKENFYEELTIIITKANNRCDILLAGDLHAKIQDQENNEVLVGRYADEVQNNSGDRLLELCNQ